MRSAFYLLLLGIILGTIAIVVRSGMLLRKNPGEPINAAMRQAMGENAYQWPEHDAMILAQRYPGARETPDGMRYLIRQRGTGDATPRHGDVVTVAYDGHYLDGTFFDSSASHDGPFNFFVGESKVIPGWDEALLTMKKGEKRTLVIPYWLGYGEKGIRGKIPPRATLVFDLELIDFKPPPAS